jgi:aspartate/methionine/tyrosine aminotransferase
VYRAAQVLQDVEFIDRFVDTNKRRLKEAYKAASEALTECGIEHVSAGAAMFIWADVRKYLRERTIESERELWNKMFKEAKILATPGESALAAEPGFLRFCFAATPINVWPEFSNRMKKILQSE